MLECEDLRALRGLLIHSSDFMYQHTIHHKGDSYVSRFQGKNQISIVNWFLTSLGYMPQVTMLFSGGDGGGMV